MKKRIEIVNNIEESTVRYMTKEEFISSLQTEEGLVDILTNYDISDDIIIEYQSFINRSVLLKCFILSEVSIEKLLESGYLDKSDLSDLSATVYSNLSQDFLNEYEEYLNLDRYFINLSQIDDYFINNDISRFLEKDYLQGPYFWRILSSNRLPKDIILNYMDKLDWFLLSINNDFSDFSEGEKILIESRLIQSPTIISPNSFESTFGDELNISEIDKLVKVTNELDEADRKRNEIVDKIKESKKIKEDNSNFYLDGRTGLDNIFEFKSF